MGGASSYKGGTTLGIPPFPNDVPWTPKISSWDVLGRLWGCLGRPWATLGRPGAPLGRPWDALGHLWGGLGTPWGASGVALGRPGAPLGWPWETLPKEVPKKSKKTLPKPHICDNGLQLLGGRVDLNALLRRLCGGPSSYKGGTTLGIPPRPKVA